MTLFQLAGRKNLARMLDRLTAVPRPQAIQELLEQNEDGTTALHLAFSRDPSLELVRTICDVMRDDPQKRNLFAIAEWGGDYPFHWCASYTSSVEVLQIVIDRFPHALIRAYYPLTRDNSADLANEAAIDRCLEDNYAKYPALLNRITAKCCLVRMKEEQGMTDFVAAREINELTRPQFVFMVLDMMKNCAMQPLAEEIMSYVGVGASIEGLHLPEKELQRNRLQEARDAITNLFALNAAATAANAAHVPPSPLYRPPSPLVMLPSHHTGPLTTGWASRSLREGHRARKGGDS